MMHKQQGILVLIVMLIFSMGIVMVYNTTSAEVLDRDLNQDFHHASIRQMVFALIAVGGAFGIFWVGYENMLKMSGAFLVGVSFLLILVFIPGIGQQINGAHRWIRIFGNSIQPSELAKCFIPLYYIHFIMEERPDRFLKYLKLFGILAIPLCLILIEPDNGTVAIIFMSLIVLLILTKVKWTYWLLPFLVFSFVAAGIALQMKHVPDRIRVYLNPELDLKGKGHQPHQAKIAAGSGGVFGKGLGESLQKLDYLPEARNDYIAAIYAEEFGFVGILILLLLYLAFAAIGFYSALHAHEPKAFYLISILTFLITFQAFLNLGVVSGLLPSKGTNLPFFSQGGSSLVVNFIALSLILNAAKQKKMNYAEK